MNKPDITVNEGRDYARAAFITQLVNNAFLSRATWNNQILDGRYGTRDIDAECGYPESISLEDYAKMYRRNDIAARVVDIEPNESWKEYPEIYETEEERETAFEQAVDNLVSETRLYSYLARLDRISGVGRYGVMFIGLDDVSPNDELRFAKPAPGYTEHGVDKGPGTGANVLYYRVFDESACAIAQYEEDTSNPRYGLPLYYNLQFQEVSSAGPSVNAVPQTRLEKVHWSRCVHVAPDVQTSEIFGTPRMENVYNRLLDLRKINGGAGEMFFKGGFPGYTFEVDPSQGELSQDDRDLVKAEIKAWEEGLSRTFAAVGVKVSSLSPQISDPEPHVHNCVSIICATKGIPISIFLGTESGRVDSEHDQKVWTDRVALRRNMYVTPIIIRQTIDRLLQYGILPPTEEANTPTQTKVKSQDNKRLSSKRYTIKWTPLAAMTETEKAEVGLKRTEALARYATAGAEALVSLPEFLTKFLKLTYQEAEAIMKAAPTELSPVLQQLKAGLEAGALGTGGGNIPTSVPKMANAKDPTKTPANMVQKPKATKKKSSPVTPPTVSK